MTQIFFDESIHDAAGFLVGAFVIADGSVDDEVAALLRRQGLEPYHDEFKSRTRMADSLELRTLRAGLKAIVHRRTRIAVLICPKEERRRLLDHALKALASIIAHAVMDDEQVEVFFDQGISSAGAGRDLIAGQELRSSLVTLRLEQDSKQVLGLQLADLVAHSAAIMLREQLGLLSKTVKVGENSGYDPDLEVDIGWELWSEMRYAFLHGGNDVEFDEDAPVDQITLATVNVAGYGLFVADGCSAELARAAEDRFGTCYLGCIH